MKILITGASGMVGRNLLENKMVFRHLLLTPTSQELNLLNFETVKRYLEDNRPELIIHCAGKVGGIQANMRDMYGFCIQNLSMGINLVQAAKNAGIKKLLNLSSSCTYPINYQNPLKEEYVLKGPLEPTNEGYALAKLSILKLCEYISHEYNGFEYKTLIPCNLYGRWDKFDLANSHMIPAVIRKIHLAKTEGLSEVEIWGDGEARREFMSAADLAKMIARAIDHFSDLPDMMNVGLGVDYSINEYYEMVKKVLQYEGSFRHDLSKPVGMSRKLLDISTQKAWGWNAQYSLEKGIQEAYQFYLEYGKNQ